MGEQIDIPFSDQTVDADDPRDWGMTLVMLTLGFVVFFVSLTLGQDAAQPITDYLGRFTPGDETGDDGGITVV